MLTFTIQGLILIVILYGIYLMKTMKILSAKIPSAGPSAPISNLGHKMLLFARSDELSYELSFDGKLNYAIFCQWRKWGIDNNLKDWEKICDYSLYGIGRANSNKHLSLFEFEGNISIWFENESEALFFKLTWV